MAIALAVEMGLFGALLFGGAGTVRWPAGWAFLGLFGACTAALGAALLRTDPELLAERMKSPFQPGQPLWDRIFFVALTAGWCGWLVLMGIDVVRCGWSRLPPSGQWTGAAAFVLGNWMMYRALRENPFAIAVVRVQAERGHRVIDTGPYAWVRHPMYSGGIFYFLGIPLLLGSGWGTVVGALGVAALCARIPGEERELARHLDGYEAYRPRVPWRLLPGVW